MSHHRTSVIIPPRGQHHSWGVDEDTPKATRQERRQNLWDNRNQGWASVSIFFLAPHRKVTYNVGFRQSISETTQKWKTKLLYHTSSSIIVRELCYYRDYHTIVVPRMNMALRARTSGALTDPSHTQGFSALSSWILPSILVIPSYY